MIDLSYLTYSYGENLVTFDQVLPYLSVDDFVDVLLACDLVHESIANAEAFGDVLTQVFNNEVEINKEIFRPDGILTGLITHHGGPYLTESGIDCMKRIMDRLRDLFETNPELFLTASTIAALKAEDDYISAAGTVKKMYLPITGTGSDRIPDQNLIYEFNTSGGRFVTGNYSNAAANTILRKSVRDFGAPYGRQNVFTDPAYVASTVMARMPAGMRTTTIVPLAAEQQRYWNIVLTKSDGIWTGTSFTLTIDGVTTPAIDASHKLFAHVDDPSTPSVNENVSNQLRYIVYTTLKNAGFLASVFAFAETSTTKTFRIYFHTPGKRGDVWKYPEEATGHLEPGYYQAEVAREAAVSITPSGGLSATATDTDPGTTLEYDWLDVHGSVVIDSNGRCQRPISVSNTMEWLCQHYANVLAEHVAVGNVLDAVYDNDEEAFSYLDHVGYVGGVSRPFHGGGPELSTTVEGAWCRASYRAWWVTTENFDELFRPRLSQTVIDELASGQVWDDGRIDQEDSRTLQDQFNVSYMNEVMNRHLGAKTNDLAAVFQFHWPQIKFGSWYGQFHSLDMPVEGQIRPDPALLGYIRYSTNSVRMYSTTQICRQFGRNWNAIPDKEYKLTFHPNSYQAIKYASRDTTGLVTMGTYTPAEAAASTVFVGNDQAWDGAEIGMYVQPFYAGTSTNDATIREMHRRFCMPRYGLRTDETMPSQPMAWFDADTLGASVTTWAHSGESGVANDLSSSARISATGNGSIATVAANLNGHRIVRLVPGSSQWLAVNNLPSFLNYGRYTAVLVVKPTSGMSYTSGVGGRVLLAAQTTANANRDIIFVSGTDGYLKHLDSAGVTRTLIETDLRGSWHVISLRFLSSTVRAYLDGDEHNTHLIERAIDIGKLSIGQLYTASVPSDFWDGDIAYVTYYMGDLTDEQRQQTEGFLAWRFGLQANLPVSHAHTGSAPSELYKEFWNTNLGYEIQAVGHLDESNEFVAGPDGEGHITALQYQDTDRYLPEWADTVDTVAKLSAQRNVYLKFEDPWRNFIGNQRRLRTAQIVSNHPSACWLGSSASWALFDGKSYEYMMEQLFHTVLSGVSFMVWYNPNLEGVSAADVSGGMHDALLELEDYVGYEESKPLSVRFNRSNLDWQDSDMLISGMAVPGNKKIFRVTWRDYGSAGFDREENGYCIFRKVDGEEVQIRGTLLASDFNDYGAWVESSGDSEGSVEATIGLDAAITGTVGLAITGGVNAAFATDDWTLTATAVTAPPDLTPPSPVFVPYSVVLSVIASPTDVEHREVTITQGNTTTVHYAAVPQNVLGPFYAEVGTTITVRVVDIDDAGNRSEPVELITILGPEVTLVRNPAELAAFIADNWTNLYALNNNPRQIAVVRRA